MIRIYRYSKLQVEVTKCVHRYLIGEINGMTRVERRVWVCKSANNAIHYNMPSTKAPVQRSFVFNCFPNFDNKIISNTYWNCPECFNEEVYDPNNLPSKHSYMYAINSLYQPGSICSIKWIRLYLWLAT